MKHIIETLEQVEQMVGRLAEKGALDIERDLLLEKIRKIYAEVVKLEAPEEVVVPVVAPVEEPVQEELFAEEPIEEPAEEIVAEPVAEPVQEELFAEEPAEEGVVEEPIEEFADEYVEEESVEEYSMQEPRECMYGCPPADYEEIEEAEEAEEPEEPAADVQESVLALYDDEDDEEPVVIADEEPEATEEATEEEPEGEIAYEDEFQYEDEAPEAPVSLRSTIGVNDKYLLMRDLFNGNSEYYDRVITKLDSFDSLDEAMIYIHDTYHWNPQSEGARLLVELLARKLY